MNTNSFVHKRPTKSFLQTYGFKYSRGWSDEESDAYLARFSVYKSHGLNCLDLRVVLYEDGTTKIDLFDSSSQGVYSPWYRNESYDKYPILKEVDENIMKLMTSMGFQERGKNERRSNSKTEYQARRGRRVRSKNQEVAC